MALFGHDEKQDLRLDSLEQHVRGLSQLVQQTQMDIASLNLTVMSIQTQLADKLSAKELDPAFETLNNEIKSARVELDRVSEAASDTWQPLQAGVSESLSRLREQVEQLKADK
ncbi:hypothetical protein LP316_07790 [Thalassotalea sp. LPB0316]|uniref:hypothetical protein n=1 Tax=Thalassotalea sp. LPB0316 TaxID=2769490 RepID=UPI001869595F|nr:hypothetical protein [Thalassotalea sp. LPB0316]QOL27176.1 hypothetical protein LP316_07790 [Thalassotalea sp. LPB0316]